MKDSKAAEPFPKRQITDSSNLEEFADDNSKFDENGKHYAREVENTVGKEKLLVTSNFSYSNSVFYPFGKPSAIFIEFGIVVCKLFEFGRI